MVLSNLGKKDTSIIDYGIYSEYNIKNEMNVIPLDLFFKPELLTFSGSNLYFPLNIKAGESIGFHLNIRKELMPDQYDKIKEILIEKKATLKGFFLSNLSKIEEKHTIDSKEVIIFEGINDEIKRIEIPKGISSNIVKDTNLKEINDMYGEYILEYIKEKDLRK